MSLLPTLPPPPLYDRFLNDDGKVTDAWQNWFSLLQIGLEGSQFDSVSLAAVDAPEAPETGIILYAKDDKNLYAMNEDGSEYKVTPF